MNTNCMIELVEYEANRTGVTVNSLISSLLKAANPDSCVVVQIRDKERWKWNLPKHGVLVRDEQFFDKFHRFCATVSSFKVATGFSTAIVKRLVTNGFIETFEKSCSVIPHVRQLGRLGQSNIVISMESARRIVSVKEEMVLRLKNRYTTNSFFNELKRLKRESDDKTYLTI